MSEEILKHRVNPNVPFTTVLETPLPFKIPVVDLELAAAHPSILEYGRSEYGFAVEQWLSDFAVNLGLTSESGVIANDYLWQGILGILCNLTLLLNQKDPSSQVKLRPDFTGLFNNILVIKGEAKTDSSEIPTAIAELIDKFHATAHFMFPSLCPVIPGIASSRQIISLHRIYYDSVALCYCQDLVKQYRTLQLEERLKFIVDIFKIAIWIVSQTSPIQFFHLATNVRTQTRNGHHVTLMRDGIVKEFKLSSDRQIPMEIIRSIYNAKLPNVEQGTTNCTTITITTVGRRLRDVVRSGELEKSFVFAQVQEAVRQLHSLGIAHCDICVDNVFVNVVGNVVFLGDLEYCQLMINPPPIGIRRADSRARTAEELDLIQLERLSDELALL
jgi:hypothetical protein